LPPIVTVPFVGPKREPWIATTVFGAPVAGSVDAGAGRRISNVSGSVTVAPPFSPGLTVTS
jgi:hypothetical protein